MYDIIMPIGSYDSLLPKSIKSALNQTLNYENFIFVIDTFSEEEYLKCNKITSKIDRNITIKTSRVGAGKARQIAIEHAKSKYIAFLDFDDFWHPSKMELQINKLEENNANFSITSYRKIKTLDNSLLVNVFLEKHITLFDLFISCPIGTSSVVCSRNIFDKELTFSGLRNRNDYATWLKIFKYRKPKTVVLPDYLVLFSQRSGSLSSKYWVSTQGITSIIKVYRELGFNKLSSILIAIAFSFLQIFVKVIRKFNFFKKKKSPNVKDYSYISYLK